MNGPPVNVPATQDQIIEILPCMPNELQLHPMELKCKLEYKSHSAEIMSLVLSHG